MNKFTSTFSCIALLQLTLVVDAQAQRAAHRPWMSGKNSDITVENFEIRRVRSVTPRASKPAVRSTRKGHAIAQQAVRYQGARYRFGGDSKAKGFDCSGLIRRVYNDLRLKQLPHNAGGLYKMGNPIRLNELRPGDLVFFKNTYKQGISHVGVYAGDNHFVHAQSSRHGVTLTSLAEPYYQLHYAGARRLY